MDPRIINGHGLEEDKERAGETTSHDTWGTPGKGPRATGTDGNQLGMLPPYGVKKTPTKELKNKVRPLIPCLFPMGGEGVKFYKYRSLGLCCYL